MQEFGEERRHGGRRSGADRRQKTAAGFGGTEQRSGEERRSGEDRRKEPRRRLS